MAEKYFTKIEDAITFLDDPVEDRDLNSFDVKKDWEVKEITMITQDGEIIMENLIATYWG